jgi:hypothetical protein
MNLCAVNGQEFGAMDGLTTWGQLLEALERGAGPRRSVVTAVRFGGVDQPSFREPALLGQAIETAGGINIDTCEAHVLVADAVEQALNGLTTLVEAAQQTADAFRSHDIADANTRLVDVVEMLQALTQLTGVVSQADIASTSALSDSDATTLLAKLRQNLEWLVSAAENQDWISAADVLEYDIVELIPKWQGVLLALATPGPDLDTDVTVAGLAVRA